MGGLRRRLRVQLELQWSRQAKRKQALQGCNHCRGITWRAHRDDDRSAEARASALSKTPIGSVDPYALKIRGMLVHDTTPHHTVSTHRHRAFAVWLRLAPPKWLPPPPP